MKFLNDPKRVEMLMEIAQSLLYTAEDIIQAEGNRYNVRVSTYLSKASNILDIITDFVEIDEEDDAEFYRWYETLCKTHQRLEEEYYFGGDLDD